MLTAGESSPLEALQSVCFYYWWTLVQKFNYRFWEILGVFLDLVYLDYHELLDPEEDDAAGRDVELQQGVVVGPEIRSIEEKPLIAGQHIEALRHLDKHLSERTLIIGTLIWPSVWTGWGPSPRRRWSPFPWLVDSQDWCDVTLIVIIGCKRKNTKTDRSSSLNINWWVNVTW